MKTIRRKDRALGVSAATWLVAKYAPAHLEEGRRQVENMARANRGGKIELDHISAKTRP